MIFLCGFYFFPTTKSHNNFYYGLVLFPFALTLRLNEIRFIQQSVIFILSGLFLLFLVISLSWGELTQTQDWIKYSKRFLYMLIFFTLVICYFNQMMLDKICQSIVVVAVLMAVVSMAAYDSSLYTGPDRLKNFGILEHEILAASSHGFAALLLIYGCRFNHPLQIWIKLCGLSILLADMLWTQSRGPLMALIVSICIVEFIKGKHRKLISCLGLLTLFSGLFMFTETIDTPGFISRNGGDSYRFEIWRMIWGRVAESPWLGLGLSADETIELPACSCIPHPHNIFLATLFYSGLAGLTLLIAVLSLALIHAYRILQHHGNSIFLVLLTYGILCGLSDGNKLIDHPRPMWLYFWLPVMLTAAYQLHHQLSSAENTRLS